MGKKLKLQLTSPYVVFIFLFAQFFKLFKSLEDLNIPILSRQKYKFFKLIIPLNSNWLCLLLIYHSVIVKSNIKLYFLKLRPESPFSLEEIEALQKPILSSLLSTDSGPKATFLLDLEN